jgi:hypothetical protein
MGLNTARRHEGMGDSLSFFAPTPAHARVAKHAVERTSPKISSRRIGRMVTESTAIFRRSGTVSPCSQFPEMKGLIFASASR